MGNKVFIITGKQGGGKTTYLQKVLIALTNNNIKIGGFIAEGYWKKNKRERFELINLKTNDRIIYCQRETKAEWEKVRHFYINPQGQTFGEKALNQDSLSDIDIVVIDEVGPFEVENKGWANSIGKLLIDSDLPMIWVVRESILFEVLEKWGIAPIKSFHIDEVDTNAAARELLDYL